MSEPRDIELIEKQDALIRKYKAWADKAQAVMDRKTRENAAMSGALGKIRAALREMER